MNYLELAEKRKSIRDFKDRAVSGEDVAKIKEYFSSSRRLVPECDVELLTLDSSVRQKLEGFVGYQGLVIGAPYYLILLSDTGAGYLENSGYICEDLLLSMTGMGLDCCWLTCMDDDGLKNALGLSTQKCPVAVIAYGYGKTEKAQIRLDIKSPSNVRATKREGHLAPKITVEDMVYYEKWGETAELDDSQADEGLRRAFYAASIAPSFLNRQPFRFILDAGKAVLIAIPDVLTSDINHKLNAGAVMFNLSAALSQWRPADPKWTLGAPDKSYELPEGCFVVGYCEV